MKKHYKDINELKAMIETLVKKTVNHYFSDWTDYDRPKLEKCIASIETIEKRLTLICRDCGTWLIFTDDIKTEGTAANTIYNYYLPGGVDNPSRNPNKYYNIDLLALTITPLKFDEKGHIISNKKAKRRAA